MRALSDAGERDLALRRYETCRDMLAREFETRPSTEMERLRSIIASGTGSPTAPTAQRSHSTGTDAPSRSAAPEGIPSLAVLPFANLSGDREQDYFADGLTNDIINALCRFRNLHVIARSSSFRYRGGDVDVRQVGRELGVQYVLEGSVRRSDRHIRVTAQLIEAATGAQVWASRYDRDVEDLLLVQDETARAIVSTFGKVVETAEWDRAARLSPDGLRAHELLFRASNLLEQAAPGADDHGARRSSSRRSRSIQPMWKCMPSSQTCIISNGSSGGSKIARAHCVQPTISPPRRFISTNEAAIAGGFLPLFRWRAASSSRHA